MVDLQTSAALDSEAYYSTWWWRA